MQRLSRFALALLLAIPAAAQGFNVDVGQNLIFWPTPSSTYGAAGGQPGMWNGFNPDFTPQTLVNTGGATTAVTLVTSAFGTVNTFPSFMTPGGDQALMEDFQWSDGLSGVTTFTFAGLADGDYDVFTYASDPSPSSDATEVTVVGSPDPPVTLTAGWPGAHAEGSTYTRHGVSVSGGGLVIELRPINAFPNDRTVCNGIQVVPRGGVVIGTTYCEPAVANSTGVAGTLVASGSDVAADNNFSLTASDLPPNQFGYFLAGQTQGFSPNAGGSQGNLCLAGNIGRFTAQVASSGAAGSITIQANLTSIPVNPAQPVLAGETWSFQCWYRDVNPGPTSNFTPGLEVTFQ